MRVKQLMTGDVVTIPEDASCRDAVALMARRKIRHLPVKGRDGRLCGIVTDRDLRHQLFAPAVMRSLGTVPVDRLLAGVPVTQVMSAPVVSVNAGDDVEEAARLMRTDKLGSLPVLEGGEVVGIVTETDLLRQIVGADTGGPDVEEIVVSFP